MEKMELKNDNGELKKKIDKYKIMKIILIFNPIPFTVILFGMFSIFFALIKFISGKFTMTWWFNILPILAMFGFLFIIGMIISNLIFTSHQIILYLTIKIIDLILSYFMVLKLEKKDLITMKKI